MLAPKWFKFYGQEYLSDPKIDRLTPTERSCWMTLLCMASLTEGRIKFLTVEALIERSGVKQDPYKPEEWEKALGVLKKFTSLDMIKCHENGDIDIINWEKRQESNMTVAERVRKHRAKNKDEDEDVTNDVTNVTPDKSREDKKRIETKGEELPDWLNKDAWGAWEQHRREIKKKLTPTTKKRQLAMLERNKNNHVDIIEKSIQNGWTGLFEINEKKSAPNKIQSTAGKYANVGSKA